MKVTAIKQQVKRHDRYSIYIDAKYSFSLSENDLILCGLRLNQEVSKEELEKLKQDSAIGKAYDRVLNYVTIRPRSRYEIETYMNRKDYEPEVQSVVLERVTKLGFVNDVDFARKWVDWRLSTSNKSKRQLQAELIQKRIDTDVIREVLEDINAESEVDKVKQIIERKGHRYPDRQKLIAYLARQGFNYEVIKTALDI